MSETTPARRAARRGAPGLLGLMVVALTAGMLALAGTTPRGIGAPVDATAQVALDQRTFVCDAALPGSVIRRGSTTSGPATPPRGRAPYVVTVGQGSAGAAYAGEQAGSNRWVASLPCSEPRSRWWFAGAGGAAITHDTQLQITNPRPGAAIIDIDVFGPTGPVTAPDLHGRTLPGGQSITVDLAKVAPANGELAVRVIARRGLITVAAADEFSPGVIGKEVREWLPATSSPDLVSFVAGLPPKPGSATLVVANPGGNEAVAEISVIGSHGTYTPTGVQPLRIGPNSVATLPLRSIFDGTAVAIRITSEQRVLATLRATSQGDIAYAAGVRPISGSTSIAVPDGSSRLLTLSSIGEAGTVTVTGYDARGRQVLVRIVSVAAATTVGVTLGAKVTALKLDATKPVLVAGLVVIAPHGITASGVASAVRSIQLPVVRPGW